MELVYIESLISIQNHKYVSEMNLLIKLKAGQKFSEGNVR